MPRAKSTKGYIFNAIVMFLCITIDFFGARMQRKCFVLITSTHVTTDFIVFLGSREA